MEKRIKWDDREGKNERSTYLNGTTRGDTLRPFLFHFIMMFVLPILAFFFSRDMFASKGYTEKELNMYPAFIALFCVIVVMTSYVFHILADKDNWTPENQPSNQKIIPVKKETVSQEYKKQATEKSGKKSTENEITEKNNTNTGDEATKKNKKKENKKTNGENKEQAKEKSDNPLEKDEIKKRDVPQKSETQNNQQKIEPKNNNSKPSGQEKQIKLNNENAADKTNNKKKK